MSQYEQTLRAYGVSPEQAARDSWVNDVVRLENHEHPNYGKKDEDDE